MASGKATEGPLSITVFTPGDARRLSTWSNVPYLLTTALERQGHVVHRVNIGQHKLPRAVYDTFWNALRTLRLTRTRHSYFRSLLHRALVDRTIRRSLRRRPDDHLLFLTFSFGAAGTGRPYALFCDMTYERHIQRFHGRAPDPLERRTVRREERTLDQARHIISLFPEQAMVLRHRYGPKVHHLGNVLNMDPAWVGEVGPPPPTPGNEIVFVGKEHYRHGLRLLLDAMPLLNSGRPAPLHLHVVGLKAHRGERPAPHVTYHGYLDKADPAQRALYYGILRRAALFVNPTAAWGAFSASLEAMYLHTPVVLFPYSEFVGTFGRDERLGAFLDREDPRHLAEAMAGLLDDAPRWRACAAHGHEAVKDMTWDRYAERLAEVLAGGGTGAPAR